MLGGSTLVEAFLQNIQALLPWVIIKSYQKGVRFTLGKRPKALEPGPHLKLWFIHQIDYGDACEEVIELPNQTVTLQDGTIVCFSANVGFKVHDWVAHSTKVQDFKESTLALAMIFLAAQVRKEATFRGLVLDLPEIERGLRKHLARKFKAWGTHVTAVGFTNLAEVRWPIRIFGDTHKMPNEIALPAH
jgi:regulator of protease activity HflC (stomatin/prohibitin superfamily)